MDIPFRNYLISECETVRYYHNKQNGRQFHSASKERYGSQAADKTCHHKTAVLFISIWNGVCSKMQCCCCAMNEPGEQTLC